MFDDLQNVRLTEQQRHKLKTARKMKGLTSRTLAAAAHTTNATITNTELGKTNPRLAILRRVCTALGLSVDFQQVVEITTAEGASE